jgi:hypothetical protein
MRICHAIDKQCGIANLLFILFILYRIESLPALIQVLRFLRNYYDYYSLACLFLYNVKFQWPQFNVHKNNFDKTNRKIRYMYSCIVYQRRYKTFVFYQIFIFQELHIQLILIIQLFVASENGRTN